jgi:glycosyltransferase involved in cell wall biosynthesis
MPKKVMIVIDTSILGGPGKGLFQLLRHETSGNYSYILCGFSYRNPRSTQFIDVARAAGCDLRLLPQRFRFDPSAIAVALKIARSEGVDLVQSHGYKSHTVALAIARRCRVPWLAMTHGWTQEDWKILLYNRLERVLLKWADIAATVSPPLYDELLALRGPNRFSRLIMNAVDPAEIKGVEGGTVIRDRYGVPTDATVIGVFGRLSPEKGVLNGLEAFAKVHQQHPTTHLMLVGDGQLSASIEARIHELGLGASVTMTGYQQQMRGYYEAIDLLMIPSLSEGLPNVLLEAMALEVPAVCTRVGAIPEVIIDGENGWLAEPGDCSDLASRLECAVSDKAQRHAMGVRARESLHPRFSPVHRAKQFVSIYDELTRSSSGQPEGASLGRVL